VWARGIEYEAEQKQTYPREMPEGYSREK